MVAVLVFAGLALALSALAAAAVSKTGRRERDRFIDDIEDVRADSLIDRGRWSAMR
jgi:hypothetical protein